MYKRQVLQISIGGAKDNFLRLIIAIQIAVIQVKYFIEIHSFADHIGAILQMFPNGLLVNLYFFRKERCIMTMMFGVQEEH